MELRIWAPKTRAVRQLARRMAPLLDEIENEGLALVIVRYRRAAAMLVPLERPVPRPPRRVQIESNESTDRREIPELDPDTRRLLLQMARSAPDLVAAEEWDGDVFSFNRSGARPDMAGLAEGDGGRRWLTSEGERVAAALAAAGQR